LTTKITSGVVPVETLASVTGLEFLRGVMEGRIAAPPIAELIGFTLTEVESGRAVFESTPGLHHYNPIGSVHGGFAATLLDSCMGAARCTRRCPPASATRPWSSR
jgi:acyl-coenzyme A thioesterase PaaI-like protein